MKFSPSPSDIAPARTFVAKITEVFADMAATDHHMERASIADEIGALIRPDNANQVVNFAQKIMDAKIDTTVQEFVSRTREFFVDELRARRAAEESDLVVSLNHQCASLNGSPSIDLARRLQSIFEEFFHANPPPAGSDREDNFAADSAAKPSNSHEKSATAEQAGTTQPET